MPRRLIKDRSVVDDQWTLRREVGDAELPAVEPLIVPLATWKAHREALRARGQIGVWLSPSDDPGELAGDVSTLPLIAVDFPQITDGRGYSIGRLLRERYGFTGELRAIGDVQHDQLYYLAQCGFNAFAIREDRSAENALAGLTAFSDGYQATNARTPWFRRRAAAASAR